MIKPSPSQHFHDYFSALAADYVEYRPRYPAELFSWLSTQTRGHDLAWDCACGSGQAAIGLVPFFKRVVATDASKEQLEQALAHPKIEYRQERVESCSLKDQSVDLVTVATALHWFAGDDFYGEVCRVLKPDGLIAAWGYHPTINFCKTPVNDYFQYFYRKELVPFLPPEVCHIFNGYRAIPFPFEEISPPSMAIRASWTIGDMLGYLRTWSATKRAEMATGRNPLGVLEEAILPLWGDPCAKQDVIFNISPFRVGYQRQQATRKQDNRTPS